MSKKVPKEKLTPKQPFARFYLEDRDLYLNDARKNPDKFKPAPENRELLNPHVASLVRRIGHTQMLVICDKGFPLPKGVEAIDLTLSPDIPTVPQVMRVIAPHFSFTRLIAAEEMRIASAKRCKELQSEWPKLKYEFVSHLDFKEYAGLASGLIRTGDSTLWGNVILVCG